LIRNLRDTEALLENTKEKLIIRCKDFNCRAVMPLFFDSAHTISENESILNIS